MLYLFMFLSLFSRIAIKGGVIAVSIKWNCNLDRDFQTYCLPLYAFRILDDFGWNFRHAKYHEENRRSLYKMYGIKVRMMIQYILDDSVAGQNKEKQGKEFGIYYFKMPTNTILFYLVNKEIQRGGKFNTTLISLFLVQISVFANRIII